ncbi:MAG TPA: thiamine phosphate synthase [Planosporangium sp.]|nr:thiamine phosphate synthase [Planosporangium sp.]
MVIVFTDRRQARRPLDEVVAAAVDGGARTVVLREKDLPDEERAALAARLHEVLAPAGGRLLLAGRTAGWAGLVAGLHGQHLAAADPWPATPRGLVGRSCHDAGELAAAAAEGAAYATISPVFASTSKPGYGPPLGLSRLRDLCAGAGLPVYALGGIESAERAAECRRAGAAGVAVMGAVMRARDPAAVVAELVAAVDGDLPLFVRRAPLSPSVRVAGRPPQEQGRIA